MLSTMLRLPRAFRARFALSGAVVAVAVVASGTAQAGGAADAFTRALQRGPLYAALASFLGGLAASLTPCVYPMIGVTVAVFGAREARSRWHAMALSSVYVLGIAAMYTPLGVAAGLTGSLFGAALASRWVTASLAALFLALSLSMFGLFELALPSRLTNRAATMGGIGYAGAFVLGLVSGVMAAPCTGPVLTGILLWIGKTQSPWLGAGALLAFSLGLGVPFWLVGTFAVALPKSGAWMASVKSLFGVVMAVVALYMLKNAFPQAVRLLPARSLTPIVAAAVAAIGFGLGALHLGFDEGRARAARKAAGIVLAVGGLVALVAWLELPRGTLPWHTSETAAVEQARRESRPRVVDFTADWCAACKELARDTFTDPLVATEMSRFVLLKVDATNDDDPAVVDVQKRHRVAGLPTVIVIDSAGEERARFTELVPAQRFYEALRDVR
jgi:thiol:disulfide interchange protein DsbD